MAALNIHRIPEPDWLEIIEPIFDRLKVGAMLVDTKREIVWSNSHMSDFDICCCEPSRATFKTPIKTGQKCCEDCMLAKSCFQFDIEETEVENKITKNGKKPRYFSVLSYCVRDKKGEPEYTLHMARDTSHLEMALMEQNELQLVLFNVLDNTADAVITLNKDNKVYSWNRGAWQVFGYTKEEMRGKPMQTLIPDNTSAQRSMDEIGRMIAEQGFVRNHRVTMQTKGKRSIDVAVTLTTMKDLNGKPFGHSLIIRDISKLVHLERQLSQKVIQLTKLLQMDDIIRSAKTIQEIYNTILVAVTSGEGLKFSRAFLFIMDDTRKRLIGTQAISYSEQSLEVPTHIQIENFESEQLTLAEIIRQRFGDQSENEDEENILVKDIEINIEEAANPLVRCLMENRPYLYVRGGADDEWLHELIGQLDFDQFVAVPLVWQDKKIGLMIADNVETGRYISMEDVQFLSSFANRAASAISNIELHGDLQAKIEELKNVYQQATEHQSASLRKQRLVALGEMASKVAHEIRNPLVSIGGFARLLMSENIDQESNLKFLNVIVDESTRLERILGEVLGWVKNPQVDMSPENINDLLKECVMIVEKQESKMKVDFLMDLDSTLPSVNCNLDRVKQAFMNIIQNGIEAMGKVGTMSIMTQKDDTHAIIMISDTGVGLDEEAQENLFKEFFTTKSRGVGLGLSITKQIIDEHNGEISVESAPGKGSTFRLRLPITPKEVDHDKLDQEEIAHS